ALRPMAHLAVDADHRFGAQPLDGLERGRIRVGHHLGEAVVVAQVDEEHAAMVADAVDPAGEPHLAADVARAERAAGMGTVTVHWDLLESGKSLIWRRKVHGLPALSRKRIPLDSQTPICRVARSSSAEWPAQPPNR